jgi:pseudaminic acid synthase
MTKNTTIQIGYHKIGKKYPTYIVAEMSANHNRNFDQAVDIIKAAKQAGADAIKLQTYTPDTMTLNCDNKFFEIKGTIWEGRTLYDLYSQAYTPWEWQPKLKKIAEEIKLDFFSTPFDETAVDFLEEIQVPAYKIASFENIDLPLLQKIARTGKPIILSTGMATLAEIDEAVQTIKLAGGSELILLKCTSAYPAPPGKMNLSTIPHLSKAFGVPAGLSDHSMSLAVPVAAVTLGACVIEKHFTLSRNNPSPDSSFSLEPAEFREMVDAVRTAEKAIGEVFYGFSKTEKESRIFRRSLFAVKNISAGEKIAVNDIRSIRPGHGLHTRYLDKVVGRRAKKDIKKGTPISWDLI